MYKRKWEDGPGAPRSVRNTNQVRKDVRLVYRAQMYVMVVNGLQNPRYAMTLPQEAECRSGMVAGLVSSDFHALKERPVHVSIRSRKHLIQCS